MARIKDIKPEPLFSPTKKNTKRKAKSLSAFVALPSILGIVEAQHQWIKRGTAIGFKDAFIESLKNLYAEARNNPIFDSMSGGRAIQHAIEVQEESTLGKLVQKGSGKEIGADIPDMLREAAELKKGNLNRHILPEIIRDNSYAIGKINTLYDEALTAVDGLVNTKGLFSVKKLQEIEAAEQLIADNKRIQFFKTGLQEAMEDRGLTQIGWITGENAGKLAWIDPLRDEKINIRLLISVRQNRELTEISKQRWAIWNTWQKNNTAKKYLLNHLKGGTHKGRYTYQDHIDALKGLKDDLIKSGDSDLIQMSRAVDTSIGELTNLRLGKDTRRHAIRKGIKKNIMEDIESKKDQAYEIAKKYAQAQMETGKHYDKVNKMHEPLFAVKKWKTLRQVVELVDEFVDNRYTHKLGEKSLNLKTMSDKEFIKFINKIDDPSYFDTVREIRILLAQKVGDSEFSSERFTSERIKDIINSRLNDPIAIGQKMNDKTSKWTAEAFYKNITGADFNPQGRSIIKASNTSSPEQLTALFKTTIEDYTAGLSEADKHRIGDLKSFEKRLRGRQRLYKDIFKSVGQEALHDSAYGTARQAEKLSKVLTAFETKVQEIKNNAKLLFNNSQRSGSKGAAAIEQLKILAKSVGFEDNISAYMDMIDGIDVSMEIKTDLHGNMAHQRAELQIKIPGKSTLKQSISLERFGQYSTSSFSKLYNSNMILGSGLDASVSNTSSVGLAQLDELFERSNKIMNDLVDSGWDPYQAKTQISRMLSQYTDLSGTATEHVQDRVRGMKVISEEFAVLSGKKSSYYYKSHALGKRSLLADMSINKTESTLASFDLEFSSPYTEVKGSTKMIRDPRTRIYWMNYVLNKGSGSPEKIVNHYIVPDNWSLIKDNIAEFMVKHQPGGEAAEDGYTKWYKWMDKRFSIAQKDFEKGVDISTQKAINPRTGKMETTHFYNEKSSMLKFAKDMYGADALDKQVTWLGQNVGTADLKLINKAARRVFKDMKEGTKDYDLIKRLIYDTTDATLIAKGNIIDTYAWARLLQTGNPDHTSLNLTSLFESLIQEAVDDPKMDHKNWAKNLSVAVNKSRGRLTQNVKHMIDDLPANLRGSIKRWVQQDWKNVVQTFGEGGHHDPAFDTRANKVLHDLLHWKTEKIRQYNPYLYDKIMQVGTVSEEITAGRKFAWYNPLQIAEQSDLFQLNQAGTAGDPSLLRSHLFAFTPGLAGRGIGAAFGPENYLPFGHKANLQKQAYQVLSQKALIPGTGAEIRGARLSASKSLFPIIRHSLSDIANTDTGFSMWMTQLRSTFTRDWLMGQSLERGNEEVFKSRLQMMAYYLPSNNSLVGEDTAMLAPGMAKGFKHMPLGGSGKTLKVFDRVAKEMLESSKTANSPEIKPPYRARKLNMREWLRARGVNSAIVDSVDASMTLEDFVKSMDSDGILKLDLVGKKGTKGSTATILEPGSTLIKVDDTAAAVWDVSTGKRYKLEKELKYGSSHPIKQHTIVKQLAFDFNEGTFLFDITPIEESGFNKLVDPSKLFKGNSIGEGHGFTYGKGIGAILGAKKPNITNMIEIHMRRSLNSIYQAHGKNPNQQKKLIKKLIKESFSISDAEFDSMFKLKLAPVAKEQASQFGKAIYVPEVISTSELNASNHELFKGVAKMLEISGVDHSSMKKMFVEINTEALFDYSKKLGGTVSKDTLEKQVKSLYDILVKQQEKAIGDLAASTSTQATDKALIINEMNRIVKKTKIALFDPYTTIQKGLLDEETFKSKGLFQEGGIQGKLTAGVYTEAMAWLTPTELGLSETLSDIKGPRKLAVDMYGTPTHKSFSIWQVMLMYNATEGNDQFRKDLFRQLLPKMGKHHQNIKNALKTYYAASLTFKNGFEFDKSLHTTYSLTDIEHDVKKYKVFKNIDVTDPKHASMLDELIKQDTELGKELEWYKQNQRISKLGLIDKEAFEKIKLFQTKQDTLFKFELPSIEKVFGDAGIDDSVIRQMQDAENKQKSMLISQIKKTLKDKATDPAERQMLEVYLKQMPGFADDVTGPLDGILVPFVRADAPQLLDNKYVMGTQSSRTLQIADAISVYSEDLVRIAKDIKNGGAKNLGTIKSSIENAMARIGAPLSSLVYEGINIHSWKANQFYAAGSQYGKAVNSIVLAKNIMGALANDASDLAGKTLSKFEGSNSIVEALEAIKKRSGKGQKAVLDKMIQATRDIKMDDVLEGIMNKPKSRPKDAIGNLLRSIDGHSFYNARGTGLNERIMPTGQFSNSLKVMAESADEDLMNIVRRLTDTTHEATEASRNTTKSAVDRWIEMLTGKRRVIDELARQPMFENKGIMNHSVAYLWHDELFKKIGMKTAEIDKIVTVNQLELALMGGDYDGDLVQRMLETSSLGVDEDMMLKDLQKLKASGELNKSKLNQLTELEELKNSGNKADLLEFKNRAKGIWKVEQQKGIQKEVTRIRENISWMAMKEGRGSLLHSGTDYGKIIQDPDLASRWLLGEMGEDEFQRLTNSQLEGFVNTVTTDEAATGMRNRGLLYMIQQTLVGPVGKQQERWDVLFGGGKSSGMKTSVIDRLGSIATGKGKLESASNTIDFLSDVSAEFSAKEAIITGVDGQTTYNYDYIRKHARKLHTELETGWEKLNKNANLSYYVADGIDPVTGEKIVGKWVKSKMTGLDYMNKFLSNYTHHVPIEKQKAATSSVLASFQQAYEARTKFHYGFFNQQGKGTFGQALKMLWGGMSAEDANAKNLLLDVESDYIEGHANKIRAAAELEKQRKLFFEMGEIAGRIQGAAARMEANQLIYGNITSFLVGRGPKAGVYGALQDAFSQGSRAWIGHAFEGSISSADAMSISTADDMAKYVVSRAFTDEAVSSRTVIEQTSKFLGDMLHGVAQGKWAKRAGVAALAMMILDPNTNSILLPDQRADGERYDIPSLQELGKTYRNRLTRFRESSPVLLDKMAKLAGLPAFSGAPGYENKHMPPPPPGMVNYTRVQHRKDALSLQQMAKQVNGILLR